MKAGSKLCFKLVAAAVALTAVIGLAALAVGAGSSTDPLVSVSYLENTFEPSVTSAVASQVASTRTSLDSSLASRISAFQSALSSRTTASTVVSEYETLTLAPGETLEAAAGTEILFLSGSATVSASGLTDASAGQTLSAGGALLENRLYLATFACTITADDEVKMLVR